MKQSNISRRRGEEGVSDSPSYVISIDRDRAKAYHNEPLQAVMVDRNMLDIYGLIIKGGKSNKWHPYIKEQDDTTSVLACIAFHIKIKIV